MWTRNTLIAGGFLTSLAAVQAMAQVLAPSPAAAPAPLPAPAAERPSMFFVASPMAGQWNSSDMIGARVVNRSDESVGEVEQLIIDADAHVVAAVVGVGGFLGMGQHRVAFTMQSIEMTHEPPGKIKLLIDVSKAQLKTAPAFVAARK